jgi:A/G-specific adenine glycosylase
MRGDFSVFRSSLLKWFRKEKRVLPWRTDPSLYRTVVSEFMLQQTQVDTVLPYFESWLRVFPGFAELAAAPEQAILKQWEGLGYYSRARNLHKLAKSIQEMGVPESFEEWLKRPGIGPYTAAAISSIAQGIPEPVIDGNVIRVLTRLTNDAKPVQSSQEGRKRLLPLAKALIDAESPGDFNEAVMELGATVCRKARPACLLCPVGDHCEAKARGTEADIPVIVRKATRRRELARLWLRRDNQLLVHVYPPGAKRLAGLAELPEISSPDGKQPILIRSRGISTEQVRESIFVLDASHPDAAKWIDHPDCRWVTLGEINTISLSAPHKRWIQTILAGEAKA